MRRMREVCKLVKQVQNLSTAFLMVNKWTLQLVIPTDTQLICFRICCLHTPLSQCVGVKQTEIVIIHLTAPRCDCCSWIIRDHARIDWRDWVAEPLYRTAHCCASDKLARIVADSRGCEKCLCAMGCGGIVSESHSILYISHSTQG